MLCIQPLSGRKECFYSDICIKDHKFSRFAAEKVFLNFDTIFQVGAGEKRREWKFFQNPKGRTKALQTVSNYSKHQLVSIFINIKLDF